MMKIPIFSKRKDEHQAKSLLDIILIIFFSDSEKSLASSLKLFFLFKDLSLKLHLCSHLTDWARRPSIPRNSSVFFHFESLGIHSSLHKHFRSVFNTRPCHLCQGNSQYNHKVQGVPKYTIHIDAYYHTLKKFSWLSNWNSCQAVILHLCLNVKVISIIIGIQLKLKYRRNSQRTLLIYAEGIHVYSVPLLRYISDIVKI